MNVNRDSLDIDKLKYITEKALWVVKKDYPEKFDELINYLKGINTFDLLSNTNSCMEHKNNEALHYLKVIFSKYKTLGGIPYNFTNGEALSIGLSMLNLDVFKKLTPTYDLQTDIKNTIDALYMEKCKITLTNNDSCKVEEDIKNTIEDISSDMSHKAKTKIVDDRITMDSLPQNLHRLKY